MDDSTKDTLSPSFRLDLTTIDLSSVETTEQLELIWNRDIPSIIAHDCAVMGEAYIDGSGITIKRIFLQRGTFNEDRDILLGRCASLLAAWNVMRNPCLMDLGPCMCIGQRLFNIEADETRSFLIHGEVEANNRILFLIFSAAGWHDEVVVKRTIARLIPPMVAAILRLAPPDAGLDTRDEGAECVRLTAREIQIIHWLVEGKTNKEIARYLGTSPNTVRNQIARLAEKSGARNRAQLASLVAYLR